VITLDLNDQQKYNLSYETLDYSRSEVRDLIKDFINTAKLKNGFTPSERTLIEVFPQPDGVISLYISCIENTSGNSESTYDYSFILEFDSLDNLEHCCSAIASTNGVSQCDSSLYFINGIYTLVFNQLDDTQLAKVSSVSSEFCSLSNKSIRGLYLPGENYRILAEHGAVRKLV
jgi:negative regulator of genetic competence, sporulation and motility